jgi:hypothetical protein
MLAAVVELREQLLAREKELERKEGAITAWEDGVPVFEGPLGTQRQSRPGRGCSAGLPWPDVCL